MPDLKVTFTLDEKDVAHLRRIMRKAATASKGFGEEQITKEIGAMAQTARDAKPPNYVLLAVEKLETIVAMTQDKAWALPTSVRKKVLAALTYFANPVDLIPDKVPGLSHLIRAGRKLGQATRRLLEIGLELLPGAFGPGQVRFESLLTALQIGHPPLCLRQVVRQLGPGGIQRLGRRPRVHQLSGGPIELILGYPPAGRQPQRKERRNDSHNVPGSH